MQNFRDRPTPRVSGFPTMLLHRPAAIAANLASKSQAMFCRASTSACSGVSSSELDDADVVRVACKRALGNRCSRAAELIPTPR